MLQDLQLAPTCNISIGTSASGLMFTPDDPQHMHKQFPTISSTQSLLLKTKIEYVRDNFPTVTAQFREAQKTFPKITIRKPRQAEEEEDESYNLELSDMLHIEELNSKYMGRMKAPDYEYDEEHYSNF